VLGLRGEVRKWDPVGAVWILTAGCLQTESPGAG